MRPAERQTLLGALAVILTSSALGPLFADLRWLPPTVVAVVGVAAAGMVARRLAVPALLQPLAAALGGLVTAVVLFAGRTLAYGVLPGPSTWRLLRRLLDQGGTEIRTYAAPVPTHDGVVLLAALGVVAVAVAVDLAAVVVGRAAVAGLPLLVLFAVPSAVRPGGGGTLPFLLAAGGWLALLITEGEGRVDRWGSPLRPAGHGGRREERGVGRVGRRIGAAALGAAVVVPVVVPGLDSQLVAGPEGLGANGRGHTATTYNPITRLRGDLVRPTVSPLLRYTTSDPEPDYLRLTTLDRYDGTMWSSSQLNGDPRADAVQRGIPTPLGLRDSATAVRVVRYRVAVSHLHTSWLPVPFPPRIVDIGGAWVWDSRAETVFSSTSYADSSRSPYTVTAARVLPDAASLADAAALPPQIAPYTDPPQVTRYVGAQAVAAVAGARTALDKARALQAFFLDPRRFRYSTSSDVPEITSPDALERFLRGGRGFCEQFSSAMAAMLRYLGVPSRVAVGFTAGQRQADGSYLVTTRDAHAWPEVWFGAAGWVRFEPTPRAGAATIPPYAQAAGAGASGQPTPAPAASADPASGQARRTTGKNLDQALREGAGGQAKALGHRGGRSPLPTWWLWGVAALALAAVPRLLHAARRRTRPAGGDGPWERLREDAADLGYAWRRADSPRAAARRLAAGLVLSPAAEAALARVAGAAERTRYAGPDAPPPEGSLAQDAALVRTALRGQAGTRARVRATVLPPTALRWAAAGAAGAGAGVFDAADRLVARVGRAGRRPRRA